MPDIVLQELGLDISHFETNLNKTVAGWDILDERARQFANQNPFKKQADDLLKFNNQLQNQSQLFGKVAQGPKSLKAEVNQLVNEYLKLANSQDKATKGGDWKKVQQEIAAIKKRLAELNTDLNDTPKKMNTVSESFGRLGAAIKGAFTATGILFVIDKVVEFGQKLIEVVGIGEGYQNQFTRIFEGNSQAAKGYLSSLQNVADTTNFTFDTLTDNAAKLASRGIIPTKNELLGLGDVANFIKKDFTQLNEAILDANNSERWKELGFTVKTEGDKMTLAYGDFSIKVDNSVKGAYQAVQAFSQLGKVQGSTAEAGETLSGRISTLEDNFAGLFRTIGQGNQSILSRAIDIISDIIKAATGLYKTLQPTFDRLTESFGGVVKVVGGVLNSFGNLQSQSEKVATTGQKIGYYFNKYVIDPFILLINVSAQVVESLNTIVLGGALAAAKLTGDKGLAATLGKQLAESGKRLKELRAEFGKTFKDMGGSLDEYTRKDNQRQRREDRRNRLNEEETQNFKPTPTKPDKSNNEGKKAEAIQTQLNRANEKQIEEKKKLEEKLAELNDKAAKEELDSLDKNNQKYIDLKRKRDLDEIEQERQKLIELGQLATGTVYYNKDRKRIEIDKNLNYALPKETEQLFNNRKAQVNSIADRDAGRLAEEEYEKERLNRTKEFRDAESKYEQDRADKRERLQRDLNDNDLALQKSLNDETDKLIRQAGESEIDFEKRKAQTLLKIKLDYYEKALKLAQADPAIDPKVVENLRTTIQSVQSELKSVQSQAKTGPQNLFQLLGLTFKDDQGNDITSQVEKEVADAANLAISTANNVLNQQIQAGQARVDSIDRQLNAKQREIDVELELSKKGLANSLGLKKQEQAALQEDRKKALAQQQTFQKIQLGINASLQASELALAVAKIFNSTAAIPVLGQIVAGVQVAALLAAFTSTIAQINSLPKYHDGGEVELNGRARKAGEPPKFDEVDARLQVGELVVKRKSYAANKGLLKHLSQIERPIGMDEFRNYIRANPIGIDPEVREKNMQLLNQYIEFKHSPKPDRELHDYVKGVSKDIKDLADLTKRGQRAKTEHLSNGRIKVTDENGDVRLYRP